MKRNMITVGGLTAAFLLVVLFLGTAGQGLAEDIPPEDRDAVIKVVPVQEQGAAAEQEEGVITRVIPIQEEGAAAEQEEGVITRVVPMGGEGSQEIEPGTIQVIVSMDKTCDLPEDPPDARGVLLDQSSSALWIGKTTTSLVDGERTCAASAEVDQLEITLTESTRFFEDATDFALAKSIDDPARLHVQQVLRPVSKPAELPRCASLLVWGEMQSGQLAADAVLFHDELR